MDTLKQSIKGSITQEEAKETLKPYEKYIQRVLDGAKDFHEHSEILSDMGPSQRVRRDGTIPEEPLLEKREILLEDSSGDEAIPEEDSVLSPTQKSINTYLNRPLHKLRGKKLKARTRSRSPRMAFKEATSRFESSKNVSSYAESAKYSRIEDALSPRLQAYNQHLAKQ